MLKYSLFRSTIKYVTPSYFFITFIFPSIRTCGKNIISDKNSDFYKNKKVPNKKTDFYKNKKVIKIDDIDVDEILVSKKRTICYK